MTFFKQFNWSKSVLTKEQRSLVECLLIEFSDIFAKHRFDVGYHTEIITKFTPGHELPLYTQGPPIHLRDELLTELALMHYYGLTFHSPNTAAHSLRIENSQDASASRLTSGKTTLCWRTISSTVIPRSQIWPMPQITSRGNVCSTNLIVHKHINV